jgi:hypothetical protein
MECRCATCFERAKLGLGFSKPKGWIKYKTPDRNVVYFCSEECMKKFVFPGELKKKGRLRRLRRS